MNDELHMTRIIDKLTDIGERLVAVETLLQELAINKRDMLLTLKDHANRISELEQHKTKVVNVKDIFMWAFMAIIAIVEIVQKL